MMKFLASSLIFCAPLLSPNAYSEPPNSGSLPAQQHAALLEGQSDFDGDGRAGTDEDNDGDNVFGTFGSIPGFLADESNGTGAIPFVDRYNSVTIVSSGAFYQTLRTSYSGMTTIEAAPGVRAIFDFQSALSNSNVSTSPCIVIHGHATLRNLTFRNWGEGVQVASDGVVTIEGCHFENLATAGVHVMPGGRAVMIDSTITRCGGTPAGTGAGLLIEDGGKATVKGSTITDNAPTDLQGRKGATLIDTLIGDKNHR